MSSDLHVLSDSIQMDKNKKEEELVFHQFCLDFEIPYEGFPAQMTIFRTQNIPVNATIIVRNRGTSNLEFHYEYQNGDVESQIVFPNTSIARVVNDLEFALIIAPDDEVVGEAELTVWFRF